MILQLSSCGSAQMPRNEGCGTSAGRVQGKAQRWWHCVACKPWQNVSATEASGVGGAGGVQSLESVCPEWQKGDTLRGSIRTNGKGKAADKEKAAMETLRQGVTENSNDSAQAGDTQLIRAPRFRLGNMQAYWAATDFLSNALFLFLPE